MMNRHMKRKLRALGFATSLMMLSATMASAGITTDGVVAAFQAEGYTRIEVRVGVTQMKVEAIRGTTKVETIYDIETGTVLKTETEAVNAGDDTAPGVSVRERGRDFVRTSRDEDSSDDDASDDDSSDDDSSDDDSSDDDSSDDDGSDDDSNDDDSNDDSSDDDSSDDDDSTDDSSDDDDSNDDDSNDDGDDDNSGSGGHGGDNDDEDDEDDDDDNGGDRGESEDD